MMSVFKIRGRRSRAGDHFEMAVFVGPDREHYALAGTLTFRREEYLSFVLRILGARGLAALDEIELEEPEVEIERPEPR